jgi:hypothetical protein
MQVSRPPDNGFPLNRFTSCGGRAAFVLDTGTDEFEGNGFRQLPCVPVSGPLFTPLDGIPTQGGSHREHDSGIMPPCGPEFEMLR